MYTTAATTLSVRLCLTELLNPTRKVRFYRSNTHTFLLPFSPLLLHYYHLTMGQLLFTEKRHICSEMLTFYFVFSLSSFFLFLLFALRFPQSRVSSVIAEAAEAADNCTLFFQIYSFLHFSHRHFLLYLRRFFSSSPPFFRCLLLFFCASFFFFCSSSFYLIGRKQHQRRRQLH